MTKESLQKYLETVPAGTEIVLRHPMIQGAVLSIQSATAVTAGLNMHLKQRDPATLWLLRNYPEAEQTRPVLLLDWAPIEWT